MLAGLSESLTLTLVVLLVLGSVCFYLYSRIVINENRMSLIESLLMDLKMSTDLRAMDMAGGDNDGQEQSHLNGVAHHVNHPVFGGFSNFSEPLSGNDVSDTTNVEIEIDDDFSEVLAKASATVAAESSTSGAGNAVLLASAAQDAPSLVSGMPINQEAPLPTASDQLVSNVTQIDNDDEIPFLDELNNVKATENTEVTSVPSSSLESMTAKELHSLAKQRRVPGESKMNRAELIEALRQ